MTKGNLKCLDSAVTYYKVDLLCLDPYPDCTHKLAWSNTSQSMVNKVCDLKIANNSELIKMVSLFAKLFRLRSYSIQITYCGSIKTKLNPLVTSVYRFEVPTETIHAHNHKLIEELKDK